MRCLTVVVALALIACSTPAPTSPRSLPTHALRIDAPLTTDVSKAATPTPVAATVIATVDRSGIGVDSIRVTWVDNETREDEFITCARFVGAAGEAVTMQCAYAHETQNYDSPVGSTGERSATLIAPAGAAAQVYMRTARYVTIELSPGSFGTMSIKSDESAPIDVQPMVVVTTRGKKR